MKYIRWPLGCSIAGLILSMAPSVDQWSLSKRVTRRMTEKQKRPFSAPVYRPPSGALPGSCWGRTRGFQREVFVCLCSHRITQNGLTVSEQPFLYWFSRTPPLSCGTDCDGSPGRSDRY